MPNAVAASLVPIVGRDAELSLLSQFVGDVAGGAARRLVIEGEPGIGKTRLAAEAIELAAEAFTVLRATGEELQHDRPFGLFVDALDVDDDAAREDRRTIAELLRAPADVSPDHRYLIVDAIEEAFEREAMRQPVCLVVEDVHWADPGSILALHRVVRRDDLAIFAIVTCRRSPRSEELRKLLDAVIDGGGAHVRLPPLDDASVLELARARLGADPGPLLSAQLARAAGNPLFVLELLGGLDEDGLIERTRGVAEAPRTVEPPPSLRTIVIRRLGYLHADALELLRTASVLGESFSAADLATVTDTTLADVLKTLAEPLAAGFIAADADVFTFRHDVVREALYTDVPPAVRKGMHLHIGRALVASGATAIRVAEHIALGADAGDRQAVAYLHDAAFEVGPRAPVTAADLAQRAASLLPNDDPERINLLMPAVRHLTAAGRIDEAGALASELAPLLEGSPLEIALDLQRMNHLVLQLRIDDVVDYARRLLDNRSLPEMYRMLVITLAAGATLQEARALKELDQVRPFAAAHPESAPAATCCWIDGVSAWMHGRFAQAVSSFEGALPGVEAWFPGGRAQGLLMLGAAQGLVDCVREGLDTLEAARYELERRGAVQYLIEHHWMRGLLLHIAGRWDDALAELAASRDLAAETGAFGVSRIFPDPTPLIHALRGEAMAASRALERVEREPTITSALLTDWAVPIRALAGDPARAHDLLRSWRNDMDELGFVPDFRTTGRSLVAIAKQAGDHHLLDGLREAAGLALDAADGVKSVEGAAQLVAGAITGDCDTLMAAVDAARAGGRPFDVAEACAEASLALLRRGERTSATELLEEAFVRYDELGARRCADALGLAVRDLGIRRGTRRPRVAARHGWDSLTETERRVVACLAEGLTNREIGQRLYISKTTVASHLRSVFRKVGVSSRTELAAYATRRMS
jgi:DNA-binding CsgD family transcriptional regulator